MTPRAIRIVSVVVVAIVATALGRQHQQLASTISAAHDITAVFNGLKRAVGPNTKGEFETTEQFNSRMRPSATAQINPLLRFDTPLMLPAAAWGLDYDADKGSYLVKFYYGPSNYGPSKPVIIAKVSPTRIKREYVAQNAFGVKFRVRKTEREAFLIVMTNPDDFPEAASLSVAPARAASLKSNLRLLVLGNPAAPYWHEEVDYDSATISSPEAQTNTNRYIYLHVSAIWLYDRVSKEVLHRLDRSGNARTNKKPAP